MGTEGMVEDVAEAVEVTRPPPYHPFHLNVYSKYTLTGLHLWQMPPLLFLGQGQNWNQGYNYWNQGYNQNYGYGQQGYGYGGYGNYDYSAGYYGYGGGYDYSKR